MSAIAGVVAFNGEPVERALIEQITRRMQSRGPDRVAHWTEGSVALGHCLLRTTEEAREERQPLVSADGQQVIVWDGRLDNREALMIELRGSGVTARDHTDAELVLSAYLAWGMDCPQRLLGDFAFAVWDARRRELVCARDPTGARPLFYTHNDRLFAFSSEEEPLLSLPGVAGTPNDDRVASLFVSQFSRCVDPRQSWFDGVLRTLPGESITVTVDGRLHTREYFTWEPRENLQFASWEECREAFEEVFTQAVDCRLRADTTPAVLMSGGLDSTSIAASIRRLKPAGEFEVPVYSVISDDVSSSLESRCIVEAIERLDLSAKLISVPSVSGLAEIEDLESAFVERPHPVSQSILMNGLVCRVAQRQGTRVMLHGAVGDLATYIPEDYLARFFRSGEWRAGLLETIGASRDGMYSKGRSPFYLLLRSFWKYLAGPRARKLLDDLRGGRYQSTLTDTALRPSFLEQIDFMSRLRESQEEAGRKRSIQTDHLDTLFPTGVMAGLEGYDRVAGQYGIEMRAPWADRRVLEFFLRLPLRFRVKAGWLKPLPRETFKMSLGQAIATRKDREHVGWHVFDRIVELRPEFIDEKLRVSTGPLGRYVSLEAIARILDRYATTRSYEDALSCYWTVGLAMWLERLKTE